MDEQILGEREIFMYQLYVMIKKEIKRMLKND